MSNHNQTSLADALHTYLGQNGLTRRVTQAGGVNDWADLVGERLAAVTTPTSVDASGTLWVRVQSAAWMQELHLMSREIVKELAAQGRLVKSIRWVAGDWSTRSTESGRRPFGRRSATT